MQKASSRHGAANSAARRHGRAYDDLISAVGKPRNDTWHRLHSTVQNKLITTKWCYGSARLVCSLGFGAGEPLAHTHLFFLPPGMPAELSPRESGATPSPSHTLPRIAHVEKFDRAVEAKMFSENGQEMFSYRTAPVAWTTCTSSAG